MKICRNDFYIVLCWYIVGSNVISLRIVIIFFNVVGVGIWEKRWWCVFVDIEFCLYMVGLYIILFVGVIEKIEVKKIIWVYFLKKEK